MPSCWSAVSKQGPKAFSSTTTASSIGEVKPLVDGLLRRAHRDGRVRRDLRGELLRGGVKLRERIDGVDQTDAQGLVRLDVAGGVDHLLGHAGADQTREALGAAEAGVMPRPVSG